MSQSSSPQDEASLLHVAIIMDGSGRWATARGLPREAGHRAGVEAVRRTVAAAPRLDVGTLTLFAFSEGNWLRPAAETALLMEVFRDYLRGELGVFLANQTRVTVIGRRDRLPQALLEEVESVEKATAQGGEMHLRLAIDYSARGAILRALRRLNGSREIAAHDFARLLAEEQHDHVPPPDIDLLIRSGGEQRLSDCVLWEGTYAELYFTARMWPDFDADDLEEAIQEFRRRERRFGRIPAAVTD
jgi:undecaprenyl diphosphate synthase